MPGLWDFEDKVENRSLCVLLGWIGALARFDAPGGGGGPGHFRLAKSLGCGDAPGTMVHPQAPASRVAVTVTATAPPAPPEASVAESPGSKNGPHQYSKALVDLVKESEGYFDRLYDDPAGHCTIGYGYLVHRGRCDGKQPSELPFLEGITQDRAVELLRSELDERQKTVNKMLKVPVSQGQFDALLDFAYNLGLGALERSTLMKKLNAGDYEGAAAEFPKWNKAGGKVLPGLVKRRAREEKLFREGIRPANSPASPAGLPPPPVSMTKGRMLL